MEKLGPAQRSAHLRRMAAEGVDILVVGGGITGCGVALDAAARGYRVGLVEKGDFASGTSSKSTKLVHGGIRYLPQYDFALVREALVERGLLTRNAPFLVQPIGFLLPLYADAKRPLGLPLVLPFGIGMSVMLQAGLYLYDWLSGRLGIRRHRRITPAAALRLVPCLKPAGLRDAFIYYDGQTDDTRLTTTVMRTAALRGALVTNYTEVTGFTCTAGQITEATVQDHLSGETLTIRAQHVINAGGVFAGRIEALAGGEPQIQVQPAKGVHLTVPRHALRLGRDAVVLPETDDGRLLFLVPWGPRITVGTTDTVGGDIDRPAAEPADVEYLLRHVNRYMNCHLTERDIISTWAGYRPLVSAKAAGATAKLSRTHAVIEGAGGLITVVGGKLTTYRRMAQDTLDLVDRKGGHKRPAHPTQHLPLEGADDWPSTEGDLPGLTRRFNLAPDQVRRLSSYGGNLRTVISLIAAEPALGARIVADLPYLLAEVVYACRYEMALTLADVLARRTRIALEDWHGGGHCAPAVAARMAAELGWDAAETARQLAAYMATVTSDQGRGPGTRGQGPGASAPPATDGGAVAGESALPVGDAVGAGTVVIDPHEADAAC
ncbi:MAG: glycerol-3-phosphate dehydrogenase/oxidase [Chloroflexota bacterium]|nr:glycerol-3-phosphate dehydrogenase/oxidase [Chloroflexota bacterium]